MAHRLYSEFPTEYRPRTWAEIGVQALKNNYRYICGLLNSQGSRVRAICVVKADGYGHGACEVAKAVMAEGCDFFAVSCIEEALNLRANIGKDADILILGYTIPSLASVLAENDFITAAPSSEYLAALSKEALAAGVRVKTHIKLDTGMNRIGFAAYSDSDIKATIDDICDAKKLDGVEISGIFSHLARADEGSSSVADEFTAKQASRFAAVVDGLIARGVDVGFKHLCNSAGALRFPQYHYDGVRLGIALYGEAPSDHFQLSLEPAMTLKTIVSHIHTLKVGESVGYGGAFSSDTERKIATLPIGYADGFLRGYSGATVTVMTVSGGFNARIVGRICMDQCMIDVTGCESISVGDEVILFGKGGSRISEYSSLASTINYETICVLSSRIPRFYV